MTKGKSLFSSSLDSSWRIDVFITQGRDVWQYGVKQNREMSFFHTRLCLILDSRCWLLPSLICITFFIPLFPTHTHPHHHHLIWVYYVDINCRKTLWWLQNLITLLALFLFILLHLFGVRICFNTQPIYTCQSLVTQKPMWISIYLTVPKFLKFLTYPANGNRNVKKAM